jgi:hypothetical protein
MCHQIHVDHAVRSVTSTILSSFTFNNILFGVAILSHEFFGNLSIFFY